MAISYATAPFSFVDSQFGTAATSTGIKINIPVIVDLKYHKRVQTKTFFAQKGMIGPDTFTEGSLTETASGFPVIRKTDFQGKKGDTLTLHQRTNLAITNGVGKVGGFQIVDAEVGWDLNYHKLKIEQWRQAVRTDGGMNEQRSPFSESFVQTEMDLLSDWSAQVQDSGILAALHYGFAYHLFRQYGTTNCPPTACANTLYGNDQTMTTSNTIANIVGAGADNLKAVTLEIGYNYALENNFDMVTVGGEKFIVVLASPRAIRFLYRDSDFRNAVQYARNRGLDNPLFKVPDGLVYNNCIIFSYDKVRSVINGYNPAGLTVSNAGATNSSITEAVYTGIGGGVASTELTHTYFLGANAVALAEGRMRMGERTENDYQQIIGRDADNIWGAQRLDWYDQTAALSNNQSLLVIVNTLIQPS